MTTFKVVKDNAFRPFFLNISGQLWHTKKPVIVGVINLTPDSFYKGSISNDKEILNQAESLIRDGSDWLDIGGCSTKPGSKIPDINEEWSRLESGLTQVSKEFPEIPISIDTFRSKIAEMAIESGASIINDISGGTIDPEILDIVSRYKTPYVLTHFPKGKTPENMQDNALGSEDVFPQVFKDLSHALERLRDKGIFDILIDPGFGFGKELESNYRLLSNLNGFEELGHPIYVGISRKSMLWKLLGSKPEETLPATSAIHLYALQKGAQILRVHDPKEAKQIRWISETLNQR